MKNIRIKLHDYIHDEVHNKLNIGVLNFKLDRNLKSNEWRWTFTRVMINLKVRNMPKIIR
jgi:hypothetical protein